MDLPGAGVRPDVAAQRGVALTPPPPVDDSRHRALVHRWLREAASGRDIFDLVADAAHPSIRVHAPDGSIGGMEVLTHFGVMLRTGFPDLAVEIVAITFAYDRILLQCEFEGQQTGALGPLPATGHHVRCPGAIVTCLDEEGLITELWGYMSFGAAVVRGSGESRLLG